MALRSVSEVQALLQQANLKEEDLLPETQVLNFSPDFLAVQQAVVLLELDAELLHVFKEGQRAVLRGDPLESAVLCTTDKTFQVREAVTSNSMLLVPQIEIPSESVGERTLVHREVSSLHHAYLEVVPCKPRLHKLRQLLKECPYQGPEQQQLETSHRYNLDELLDRVQCSEEELEAGLRSLGAFHIYGFWQTPEFNYLFRMVSHITNLVAQRAWPLNGIPYEEALDELSKLEPRTVMAQCLDYYLHPMHEEREGDSLHALHGDKVCRLFGEVLIKSSRGMSIDEFRALWANSVPEGLDTNLGQLEGLILLDKSAVATVITYFPNTELPLDAKDRFEILFDVQEKWTYDEIRPFIDDLGDSKNPVSTLLMKHARASTKDGIKYYTGRYAK
ncbi:Sister chromatid cohesion protein DCC1 [Chionoecetes opilio]|uniref:Sister chromatid cohesion protein DCC1 n=1 Tax=Chionoecetes opilio TaxID=41210 RepID=A0A8J4YNS1_CHIOP|nr:Sister chromatid cohesion protein DCC1 [Chionoecetes opilio]